MARPRHKLTSAELKAKRPRKYSDGDGLWFHSRLDNGVQWLLRYTIFGRRHEMGLGSFPAATLKAARQEPEIWQAVVREGKDSRKEPECLRRAAKSSQHILNDIACGAVEKRKADLKGDGKAGRRDKTIDFRVPHSHEAQNGRRNDGWNPLAESRACRGPPSLTGCGIRFRSLGWLCCPQRPRRTFPPCRPG